MSGVTITRRDLLTAGVATPGLFLLAGGMQVLRSEPNPFKVTMTTLFWVGEPSNEENDFIPNDQSYWDKDWQENYGGDDPERRNRHWPAGFTPKQNPFYVALPYGEFTEHGDALKHNARHVPWYRSGLDPLLKNRWVEIRRNDRSCFAQWQDVGPCGEDDFDFVFGTAGKPRNTFDAKAGLDVSPAVWHHLGMTDNGLSAWRFVEEADVPAGPWTEIVTTLGNNR